MEIIIIGLLATAALVYVAYPLVSPKRHLYYLEDMLGLGEQKKLNYLYSKRNLAYDNIKDLENEFAMGKLSEADFTRLRDGLLVEAQEVLAEIDKAHVKREIEDLIEADARDHRRIK
ncbi:MAG: hypothetical protein OEO21_05545 [Candidatus Krumholzibacteria bacterium]|nr:hypothetical protein [Candidatus Krumholzibacteria bacterium]